MDAENLLLFKLFVIFYLEPDKGEVVVNSDVQLEL